jgi:hypothetical protein
MGTRWKAFTPPRHPRRRPVRPFHHHKAGPAQGHTSRSAVIRAIHSYKRKHAACCGIAANIPQHVAIRTHSLGMRLNRIENRCLFSYRGLTRLGARAESIGHLSKLEHVEDSAPLPNGAIFLLARAASGAAVRPQQHDRASRRKDGVAPGSGPVSTHQPQNPPHSPSPVNNNKTGHISPSPSPTLGTLPSSMVWLFVL